MKFHILSALLLLVAGCTSLQEASDEEGVVFENLTVCTDSGTGISMTVPEAQMIAGNSECADYGSLTNNYICNEGTGTY